ncbi:MAG: hypothetical protein ACRYFK_09065 [Janthinobacterium lividum]
MEYLHYIISALNEIEQRYIRLPAMHKASGLIRERVFCYEFYHQMRKIIPGYREIVINGEIDKRGYPTFNNQNPDFVFHVPGSNAGNAMVCEVKGDIRKLGLAKDLETICNFIEEKNYQAGVLIIFANSFAQLMNKANDIIQAFAARECADKIWLIMLPKYSNCQEAIMLSSLCV